jgi:predicted outer membrane repeat protein
MKKSILTALTAFLLMSLHCYVPEAVALDAGGTYEAGQSYDGGIDADVTTIEAGDPATETGPVSGDGPYNITGAGVLHLRSDSNELFNGELYLQSGTVNVVERSQLIMAMSKFHFDSAVSNASSVVEALAALKADPTNADLNTALGEAVANLGNSVGILSLGTEDEAALIIFNSAFTKSQGIVIDQNKAGRVHLAADSQLTFENYSEPTSTNSREGAVNINQGGLLLLTGDEGSLYVFQNNQTNAYGGAVHNNAGTLIVSNAVFKGNKSRLNGVVVNNGAASTTFLGNVIFQENTGGASSSLTNSGTGMFNFMGTVEFTKNTSGTAANNGTVYSANGGKFNFYGETFFKENSGGQGGAISSVAGSNGSVFNFFEKVSFEKNTSNYAGGAISSGNTVLKFYKDVVFSENKTTSSGSTANGGAINLANGAVVSYPRGTAIFLGNTTFTKNKTNVNGGAVFAGYNTDISIELESGERALFSGNTATAAETPNSIYFNVSGTNNYSTFSLNAASGAEIIMHDPMTGYVNSSNNGLAISMNGQGVWKLGGNNVFTGTSKTVFSVNSGTLYLYRKNEAINEAGTAIGAGSITLSPNAGSIFELKSGATLSSGGGNIVTAASGSVSLARGSTLSFNLNGADSSVPLLTINGALNVAGSTDKIKLDFADLPETEGFYQFILVETGSAVLTASNVDSVPTHLNELINPALANVLISFSGNQVLAGVTVQSALTGVFPLWVGDVSDIWNASVQNFMTSGVKSSFNAGNIVNFDASGQRTALDLDGGAITASAVYVRGVKDYSFANGSLTIDPASGGYAQTDTAANGKLVLGAFAVDASTFVPTNFKGTVDLSLPNAYYSFQNGVDVYSGRLNIADSADLGTDLSKLRFLADTPLALGQELEALRNALEAGEIAFFETSAFSLALDESREAGSLPALIVSSSPVEFDGGNSSKHALSLAAGKAGSIFGKNGGTFVFKNGVGTDGGAVSLGDNSLFRLSADNAGSFFTFKDNGASGNGGAVFNREGVFTASGATFSGNSAQGGGGAVYNDGGLVLLSGFNSFTGNSAGGSGGALFSGGQGNVLRLGASEFKNNQAAVSGGAVHVGGDGILSLALEAGENALFSGNSAAGVPNSIHFAGGGSFFLNLEGNSILDVPDPMTGTGKVRISQNGPGLFKLGGDNRFEGDASFTVSGGALRLYRAGEIQDAAGREVQNGKITLSGPSSLFTLGDGATLVSGGGNAVSASSIVLKAGSTLSFSLNDQTAEDEAILALNGAVSIAGGGKIGIDFTDLWGLTNLGRKTYTLVSAGSGSVFSENNVDTKATYRGEEITGYNLGGGTLSVTAAQGSISAEIDLLTALSSKLLFWKGGGESVWNISSTGNWLDGGANEKNFLHGDIVNFDGTGAIPSSGIALNPGGVETAGLYFSGAGEYKFTGGYLVTNKNAGSWQGSDTAAAGKLVLGARASGSSAVDTLAFTGLVDLGGTGANDFREGMDLYSGGLRVANAGQLGTGLKKLSFLSGESSTLVSAGSSLKQALANYTAIPNDASSNLLASETIWL